jgi:hypothetical protein
LAFGITLVLVLRVNLVAVVDCCLFGVGLATDLSSLIPVKQVIEQSAFLEKR